MSSSPAAGADVRAEPSPRRAGLVALLVLLVGVALALAATSVLAYLRAREVEQLLGRSQAEQLQRAIAPSLRRFHDEAALARLVDEHRSDGLRYVAVLGPGGVVRAEAGASLERASVVPPPGPPREGLDRRMGSRWRIYSPPPPHPRGGPPPGPPHGAGVPPARSGGRVEGPGAPPPFLVEVEPSAGAALRREATRSLIVGLVSALALCGVAILLVRWVRHRDRLEARVAHDRRLAALGEMSAVLAHEIRNPLASLKGHAQLLVENLDGPERERDRAKATRVVDEAVRLERLTNDLLEFARTGRIERAPCDPAAVLSAAAASLDASRIVIVATCAPARWSLDAGRMAQVLTNLLGNALDAAPAGEVTATVTTERDRLVYRVRDRGPGLPPGGLGRLAEPFHTTRVQGVGLGLAVAQRLVALHGGALDGRTHPDGGAEVTVSIPPEPR